jgi:hypothetical protein
MNWRKVERMTESTEATTSITINGEAAMRVRKFAHQLSQINNGHRVTLSQAILRAFELADRYIETSAPQYLERTE